MKCGNEDYQLGFVDWAFGTACERHDANYDNPDVSRFAADVQFGVDIFDTVVIFGLFCSIIGFSIVRLFGKKYKS